MCAMFTERQTIGEIVNEFPGASHMFKQMKVDFCCGGDRLLGNVLRDQGIEQGSFLTKLNAEYAQAKHRQDEAVDWREASSEALIDHIVQTHHAYLTKELPVLSEFTTKIVRVHGTGHPELALLHRAFHKMKTELELHLISEEQSVFPRLLDAEQSGDPEAARHALADIGDAEDEHAAVGGLLKEIRKLTADYTLPPEACRTYTLTFQKLEALESDLFEHIHLENNVLFPRLRRA